MTDTVNVPREWVEEILGAASNFYVKFTRDQVYSGDKGAAIRRLSAAVGSGREYALAAAPKAEPEKTDPQIAFENMRRHFPNDLREWTDLTEDQRREWEEDVSERPHLYNLSRPKAPKVEQEPVDINAVCLEEALKDPDWLSKWNSGVNPHTHPSPASDELLGALEDIVSAARSERGLMRGEIVLAERVIAKHKGPQS